MHERLDAASLDDVRGDGGAAGVLPRRHLAEGPRGVGARGRVRARQQAHERGHGTLLAHDRAAVVVVVRDPSQRAGRVGGARLERRVLEARDEREQPARAHDGVRALAPRACDLPKGPRHVGAARGIAVVQQPHQGHHGRARQHLAVAAVGDGGQAPEGEGGERAALHVRAREHAHELRRHPRCLEPPPELGDAAHVVQPHHRLHPRRWIAQPLDQLLAIGRGQGREHLPPQVVHVEVNRREVRSARLQHAPPQVHILDDAQEHLHVPLAARGMHGLKVVVPTVHRAVGVLLRAAPRHVVVGVRAAVLEAEGAETRAAAAALDRVARIVVGEDGVAAGAVQAEHLEELRLLGLHHRAALAAPDHIPVGRIHRVHLRHLALARHIRLEDLGAHAARDGVAGELRALAAVARARAEHVRVARAELVDFGATLRLHVLGEA
mmetsp:Transcript_72425/g.228297  ORF Transcript_72425/g.228297 Transcript_72425/m.228297 type:complete len:438 (+) Transcript_72425:1342-2655(+)